LGLSCWRQSKNNLKKIKKLHRKIQQLKRYKSKNNIKKDLKEKQIKEAHIEYVNMISSYIIKVNETVQNVKLTDNKFFLELLKIDKYVDYAKKLIDQIERRVINNEIIPHEEKIFSIFEDYTEWICKGKAGVPVELGLRVCILKDQNGFILNYKVMEKTTDDKIAIPIVEETKSKFENLKSCSFDKGFYSPFNLKILRSIIDVVIMSKKGKLSQKEKEVEHSDFFIQEKNKHSAVESAINALENHGLDRCPDRGIDGFKRYVSLAVLGRNLQIIGHSLQQKALNKQQNKAA